MVLLFDLRFGLQVEVVFTVLMFLQYLLTLQTVPGVGLQQNVFLREPAH